MMVQNLIWLGLTSSFFLFVYELLELALFWLDFFVDFDLELLELLLLLLESLIFFVTCSPLWIKAGVWFEPRPWARTTSVELEAKFLGRLPLVTVLDAADVPADVAALEATLGITLDDNSQVKLVRSLSFSLSMIFFWNERLRDNLMLNRVGSRRKFRP